MADTQTAAAPAANPAELSKTENTVDANKSESKVSDSKPEEKASKADGEEKWEINGKSDSKNDRRNDREDRNDRSGRNDRRDGGRGRGGRGGRGGFRDNHKKKTNNLDTFENLPDSDDPNEIRAQVEFYFSTQNLATDEHMFKSLEGPKNTPVSIHHVCTFKRMRRFKPYSAVVAALRESKDLEVVDDGEYSKAGSEAVKRKEPISVPAKDGDDKNPPTTEELFYRLKHNSSNNMDTSAYVKGFGNEEDAGQIALEKFFRPYGAVMIRKRREDDGAWKGSVFVEFDSEDSRKQFLELDPTPKYNGNELTVMGKKEYIEMKCKEKGIKPDWELTEQEKHEQRKRLRGTNGDGGRGRGRGGGRGQRGGRGNDRRDNRRDGNRNRSRSPRGRRDRSGSVDSNDWNKRRDRFRDGKDDRSSRKEEKKEIERDAHGVPVIKDSSNDNASNKRKADDGERIESPKKNKLEIKQDE